jgi:hypothetical protein
MFEGEKQTSWGMFFLVRLVVLLSLFSPNSTSILLVHVFICRLSRVFTQRVPFLCLASSLLVEHLLDLVLIVRLISWVKFGPWSSVSVSGTIKFT